MSEKQPKMVRILWLDARIRSEVFESEFDNLKEQNFLAPYDCIGFIIRETKDVLVISQSRMPKCEPRDEEVYRHLLFIPKVQIKKIVELNEKQNPKPKPKVVSRVEVVC